MESASLSENEAASAPPLRLLLQECGAPLRWMQTRQAWRRLRPQLPRGAGQPVLVLPGYLTSDGATRGLRSTLRELGYTVYGWDCGHNLGLSRALVDSLLQRLHALHEAHGVPVALVGWSLGGIIARELARRAPQDVRMVASLGSPFRGNVRANHLWPIYRWLRRRRRPAAVSASTPHPLTLPLPVPTTCFYSRRDGLVAWQCCTSAPAPHTENIEVNCGHFAYAFDPAVLAALADRLALPAGEWRPYHSAAFGKHASA